jgi:hypothetical protein
MKTDDLIAMLSTNVEPVDRRQVTRVISVAVAVGAAAAIGGVLVALGVRTDLLEHGLSAFMLVKLVFSLAIVVPAAIYLTRLARPGGERKTRVVLTVFPFVAVMLLAAVSLILAPRSHWDAMIMGDQWLECMLSIPIIAIVPFAVIIWAVRQTSPTDLARTGALAGLVAGGLSAAGYALHCADDSMPFVALWYCGTIALCTFAGWKLGPWLLRW